MECTLQLKSLAVPKLHNVLSAKNSCYVFTVPHAWRLLGCILCEGNNQLCYSVSLARSLPLQSHCGATVTIGSKVVESLVEGAVAANVRLRAFEEMWPYLFEEVVAECREEMEDLNLFMREGVRNLYTS